MPSQLPTISWRNWNGISAARKLAIASLPAPSSLDRGQGAVFGMRADLDDDVRRGAEHRAGQPLEHELRCLVAQLRLEHLADGGQRHRRDDHHFGRRGGALRDVCAGEFVQFAGLGLRAGFQLHEGDRHLAGMGIGPAHGSGDFDGGVAVQHFLDRQRVDVVAAADDHVLGPAGEPQIAVGVEPAEVAGVEPGPAGAPGRDRLVRRAARSRPRDYAPD